MLDGFFIFKGTVSKFTPPFPRGGLAALFGINLQDLWGASPALDCEVQHKNFDDTSWTTLASFTTMSTIGIHTADVTGLKEEIRLKFTVAGTAAANGVYLGVLTPMWRAS